MNKPSLALVLPAVVVLLCAACWGGSDEPGEIPPGPTLREQCERSCTAGSEHPCAGEPFDSATCTDACEAKLSGKPEACSHCYFGLAGLRGTSCECTTAEVGSVSADLACEECTYIGGNRSCQTQLVNKCSAGTKACQGYEDAELDNLYCADACGLPRNPTSDLCEQTCLPPSDPDHPCNGADTTRVEACRTACVAATQGKSKACETCYQERSYWLGTTCDCDSDNTDCTECSVLGNRGGTSQECADVDYVCNETPQCRGWQSREIACAACGQPDAGSLDAGPDAAGEGPETGSDASPADADASPADADATPP